MWYYTITAPKKQASENKKTAKNPKRLPILLLSGRDDAIGEFGKGVTRVYDRYNKEGIHDVSMKLYPGMRLELLHETERKQVQEDILSWIEEHFEQD